MILASLSYLCQRQVLKEKVLLRARDMRLAEHIRYQSFLNKAVLQAGHDDQLVLIAWLLS